MPRIKLIVVGDIKEEYIFEIINLYSKFAIEIIEVKGEFDSPHTLRIEAERIMKHLEGQVIVFDIGGKSISKLNLKSIINSHSTLSFVIGGSLGIDESIKRLATNRLSISNLTFPHQLMRVLALDVIARQLIKA